MAHFEAVRQEKEVLKRKLLQSQEIVDLLMNIGNNTAEFEHYKTGSKSPAAKLIKTHFYVPDTTTVDKNFITMRSTVSYTDTNVIKEVTLTVYVICNEDQVDLLQGSRADLLADEVDNVLNVGEKIFGLGDITIGNAEEIKFIDGYVGWEIPYTVHEMNRKAENL